MLCLTLPREIECLLLWWRICWRGQSDDYLTPDRRNRFRLTEDRGWGIMYMHVCVS
jgi:hypothetical protein